MENVCGQLAVDTESKGKKGRARRNKEIRVTYINEMPIGSLERVLVDIYARKIKNGTLNINISE